MGGQAQENLSQNWLTPEALIDFIEELRHVGFNIGMAEYIAAQDLLLMLTARGESLQEPRRAASLLGPLLCSSPAEQDAFPDYFERWAKRHQASLASEPIIHEETMTEALDNTAKRGLRWEWLLFIVGVIVLVITSWYVSRNFINAELPSSGVVEPDTTMSDSLPLIQLASVAIGVLILASVAWWVWWRRVANQFLQRRQSGGAPDIKQISLTASDEALFPSLTFLSLARMFRQREKVVSRELNVVRTVEHSVKQGGWLNPIYDRLLIPPEYLVLVDRRGRFDHLAEFVEGMIKRLETHGVFITAYVFDGDPRLCFPLQGKDAPRSLNELAARYDNMRLIIFSEAQGLLSPVSGRLAPWSRLFNRWIHRSVLTPESPMNWGVTEHELQREFTVLPGTTDGLATFMRIIQGEEKVGEINAWADSAVPAILQERPQRWIERDAPPASQIDALLEELRVYLGEEGYAWFESCAVYPELQWQITITLGKLLKDKNGISLLDSKRMIDLARLPWFRYGIMPDWLRTRLVLDLEPDQEEEIRAVLEALLVTAVQGHGESLNLEVAYERRDWTSRFARPLLRLLQRVADTENPVRDHVFLDFMLQRFNLAVRVPETFRRQLFSRIGDQVGWKLLLQWIGVNLLPVITLTIVYLDPAGFFSTFTFMAGALQGLALGLAQWWFLRRFWRLNFWLWAGSIIFGVGLAIYINQLTGTSVSINYFGFWIMTVLGLIQSALLARWNVHFVQMWLFGSLLAGLINSIMSYFLPADINSAFLDFIGVMVASSIIYSLVSGWVFLYILRKRDSDSIRLVRSIWVVVNAVGFFLGFFLGALVAYVGGDINDMYVYLFLPIWMFVIAISQWFALRSFRFRRSGAWLICTFIAFVLGYLLSATENLNKYFYDYLYDLSIVSWIGLAIGTISGLFQALIWRRSGLKPFQMLVWFLSNSIGWLITLSGMVVLEAMSSISLSLDHFLAAAMLIGMAYGLITCWPLQPFLREAIRHQQASKESETYIDRKPWFLPLAIISKLRSRDPSARNSL